MSDIVHRIIGAMSEQDIQKVQTLENEISKLEQVSLRTEHVLHAGVYLRTIFLPANTLITGALIKIPTTLIVTGDCIVYIGGESKELHGYNVIPASAHRKQAFVTLSDTTLTMLFRTTAETISDAEMEFTDDYNQLGSRREGSDNHITIIGD